MVQALKNSSYCLSFLDILLVSIQQSFNLSNCEVAVREKTKHDLLGYLPV
jgi:hypothetical protein